MSEELVNLLVSKLADGRIAAISADGRFFVLSGTAWEPVSDANSFTLGDFTEAPPLSNAETADLKSKGVAFQTKAKPRDNYFEF